MGKTRWMRIAEDLEGEQEGGQGCNAVSDQTHACNFKVRIVLKRHLSKVCTIGQYHRGEIDVQY